MLDTLDNHPVLASAAYNAGPGRARAWRADAPMEAAIYAETIPFNETRDYVKKVMSNASYYSQQFGQTAAIVEGAHRRDRAALSARSKSRSTSPAAERAAQHQAYRPDEPAEQCLWK